MTRPITERWARWGPPNRELYVHVPQGGVCLSAFVVVRNRAGDVLFGRPRAHPEWPTRGCLPLWRVREISKNGEWILPASHLLMEEAPDHAAKRIAREFAGLSNASPRFVGIDSARFPVRSATGKRRTPRRLFHWTLGFLYELRTGIIPPVTPWWEELRFIPRDRLRSLKIGRLHRDILRAVP